MKEHAPSRSSGSARVSRCPDRSRQPSSQLLLRQRRVSASDPPRDHRPLYRQLYRMKARDGLSADRQTLGVHDEQRHYRNDHRRCGDHYYCDRNSPVDLTNFAAVGRRQPASAPAALRSKSAWALCGAWTASAYRFHRVTRRALQRPSRGTRRAPGPGVVAAHQGLLQSRRSRLLSCNHFLGQHYSIRVGVGRGARHERPARGAWTLAIRQRLRIAAGPRM